MSSRTNKPLLRMCNHVIMQWLEQWRLSHKVLGLTPSCEHSELFVFPLSIPQSKNMQIRLIGDSKLLQDGRPPLTQETAGIIRNKQRLAEDG